MYQEYFLFDVMHKIALCEYCLACFCVCCFRRVVSYESPARKPHRRITASRTHNACADVNDHRSTWSNYRINMQEYGPFGRADDTKRARCLSFFRRGARENRAAVRHIHIHTWGFERGLRSVHAERLRRRWPAAWPFLSSHSFCRALTFASVCPVRALLLFVFAAERI